MILMGHSFQKVLVSSLLGFIGSGVALVGWDKDVVRVSGSEVGSESDLSFLSGEPMGLASISSFNRLRLLEVGDNGCGDCKRSGCC